MKLSLLLAVGRPLFAYLYGSLLVEHGYRVETTNGGFDCVGWLRQRCFDLLIIDQELPWGGGEGVLDCMRDQPAISIPVIMLTALPKSATLSDLIRPPVVAYLRKPVACRDLLASVQYAESQRSSMSLLA